MVYKLKTWQVKLNVKEPTKVYPAVSTSDSALSILKEIFKDLDHDQEHFVILCLDSKNQIKGYKVLFSGGQNSAHIDLKIVFRNALLMGAISIIVAHNHPSGNINPSAEDDTMTQKIKQAGEIVQVKLLDHIIITDNNKFSYMDNCRI